MKKRHIVYITGTRGDFGLMKNVLREINKNPEFRLSIIVTGMHLMDEFGNSLKEVEKENFTLYKLNAIYKSDDRTSMAEFAADCLKGCVKIFKKIKPDILLVIGDRAESIAASVAAAYMKIPIAHIHGGDKSATIDEPVRHAITKLASIHLAATKFSAERIEKMGEEKWRIFVVGAPSLDAILNSEIADKKTVEKKLNVDLGKPVIIVLQHPSFDSEQADKQMTETMDAVKELGEQTIVIYPNADAGGRKIIDVIEKYRRCKNVKIFKNIEHSLFLGLMKTASVMIGNSSCGIIEAPSFNLPVVNIGERQDGRDRCSNVVDVGYNKKRIVSAIKKALYDKEFIKGIKGCKNIYGDGKTAKRIVKILSETKIDNKLLQKRLTYQ
ncbi:MAG: UDP-N-acetylglucosamine 2-epimerase [Candidatus Woesearchaeota archaeon]|nr:UDP-N-acetylglucosamine 2-epimerase [Candidatus Woesearchaeota archaeon]